MNGSHPWAALITFVSHILDALSANKKRRIDHCLKHALGCILAEQGVPLQSIQRKLGHKSLASMGVYISVTDELRTGHCQDACHSLLTDFAMLGSQEVPDD